jgi:hypothetical protein
LIFFGLDENSFILLLLSFIGFCNGNGGGSGADAGLGDPCGCSPSVPGEFSGLGGNAALAADVAAILPPTLPC